MIFDVMAFKNDVSFWSNIQNFEGISVRAIGWRAISQVSMMEELINGLDFNYTSFFSFCFTSLQIVILLYLYDNDTSRLVLLSNFVSTAIELWKLTKAMKISLRWNGIIPVGFNVSPLFFALLFIFLCFPHSNLYELIPVWQIECRRKENR